MQHSWKHSLAGLVLVSALGSDAGPVAAEQPPEKPTGQSQLLEPLVLPPTADDASRRETEPDEVAVIYQHDFDIPFRIEQVPNEIKVISLLVSSDRGKTWTRMDTAVPGSKGGSLHARDLADGEHWFSVQTIDKDGRAEPADRSKAKPMQKVRVQTSDQKSAAKQPLSEADTKTLQETIHRLNSDIEKLRVQKDRAALERAKLMERAVQGEADSAVARYTKEVAALNDSLAKLDAQREEVKAAIQQATAKRTRIFRLKNRPPDEVRDILQLLLDPPAETPAAGDMMGAAAGPRRGAAAMMGGAGGPGMGSMMGAGGKGGPGGFVGSPLNATWRMAVDTRTNTLIIRGTEKDLQMAADLVAVLDVPADRPVPNVKNVTAFKLKFAPANEVAAILRELELGAQIVPDERANSIIIAGPEAARKEIGELIGALDVEGRDTPKRDKKKQQTP